MFNTITHWLYNHGFIALKVGTSQNPIKINTKLKLKYGLYKCAAFTFPLVLSYNIYTITELLWHYSCWIWVHGHMCTSSRCNGEKEKRASDLTGSTLISGHSRVLLSRGEKATSVSQEGSIIVGSGRVILPLKKQKKYFHHSDRPEPNSDL